MPIADAAEAIHFPPRWGLFADRQNLHPIRAELFSLDHLEAHAQMLGKLLAKTTVEIGRPLPRDFADNADKLRAAHLLIGEAYRNHETLGTDAEWLMDNYHIIRDTLAEIRTDLPTGYYHRLPKLIEGPLAGYPRVYALALDLIAHCDSGLDDANITRFVQAFQVIAPLTVGEIWAIPIMLRLCLIENLRRLAEHIVQFRAHRLQAHTWITDHLPSLKKHAESNGFHLADLHLEWRDCYIMHLLDGLHDQAVVHPEGVERLEKALADKNDSSADVLRREKQRQAANQVSIGNCVTSLRLLSAIDWSRFFERTSRLEAALRQDPAGIYPRQDFATRDRYRRAIEKLACGSAKDELEVARLLLDRARTAQTQSSDLRNGHIGYFLLDQGAAGFEKSLNYRPPIQDWLLRLLLAYPNTAYFGGLTVLLVALLTAVAWTSESGGPGWMAAAVLAALIPVSELTVALVNFLVVALLPPRTLPSMDFKDGVPTDCSTFVVVPCLLTSHAGAAGLVERLEIHYLSNPDTSVFFGLLSDFTDAPSETMPEDAELLGVVADGIRALNEKYCPGKPPIFFLLHRRRQWNPAQECWMGWERKRGKLAEFNRWLRGAKDTRFTTISSELHKTTRIRFVITLDTDTQLPRETARRMIALLAHPLNQPQLDPERHCVVRGYGVVQPRVGLSLRGARKSMFARLFSGSAGLDPYTTAVSDTYQDLFGSGSFSGKGIYDVDAFVAVLGSAFPDNHILSHDLIEGNYAHCGLATELELLDDFPNHYLAYARREHRWIRGDWQILPWLFGRVPSADGKQRANSLPLLARWKIFDNLRRSLTPIALIVMLVLGWTILPGSAWTWTGLVVLVLANPLILQLFGILRSTAAGWLHGRSSPITHREIGSTAGQIGLGMVFLAAQSYSTLDAILRTLFRVFVSKKRLLDWESAAATERRLNLTLPFFARTMWPAPLTALALGVILAITAPAALLPAGPFLLAWLLSPWVAFKVSQPLQSTTAKLSADEEKELRHLARNTWTFFETFVGAQDHWLPPDNHQEDPKNETAHRTSPTNIGLYLLSCVAAHDFGYVSLPTLIGRIEKTLDNLDAMEQSHGHFYNWYDTQTLQPLHPLYLSTVDSGNLVACFVTLKQSLLEKIRSPVLGPSATQGIQDTVALIERCVAYLEIPKDTTSDPVRDPFEGHLRTLVSLLEAPPSGAAEWSDRLNRLAEAEALLEQQTDALQSMIEEPPDDLRRRIGVLSGLLRDRREEAAGLLKSAGAAADLDKCSLAVLADLAPGGSAAGAGWARDLLARCHDLLHRLESLSAAMDFKVLYNTERNLFAVGYNLSLGKLDNSHYDLLASEASLTSFLAVARGEAPRKHWFHLGRPLTEASGHRVLFSWGGTMFEYLMPRLFLSVDSETLLGESQLGAVAVQIDYGRQCGTPWGISESAFNQVDGQLNYQYQAFGTPALGLKRGLSKDLVIAPYATGLAFLIDPRAALENLRRLRTESAESTYGWYEAIDYTAERLPKGRRSVVVKCYMAHHQGMTLLGLANCLLNNPVTRRFRAEPMVRATELLLQERVPAEVPVAEPQAKEAAALPTFHEIPPQMSRRVTTPHTAFPRMHVLASARHSLMVTSAGSSFSGGRGLAVTRWREDRTRDCFGQFYYLRDIQTGDTWSAGYQPIRKEADEYEVTFSTDKVEFRRSDGSLETHLEITVSPENHAEVWRLTIANHDHRARDLELTSYLELVLGPQAADLAHPAFGKLFLETEYIARSNALLCRRRPRAQDETPIWCVHLMTVEGGSFGAIEYETDRGRFLGRGRTPANPAALDANAARLSGTTGAVLDPIFSLRRRFHIESDASIHVAFMTALADSREEAFAIADSYADFRGVHRAFELAWAHTQVELRQLHLTPAETHLFQRLATHFLFVSPVLRPASAVVAGNRQGQADLWRLGLSGDLPIVLVRINSAEHLPLARQVVAAHSFWRLKGLSVDLVILNEEIGGYFEELQHQLQLLLRASQDRGLVDKPGGVFLRRGSHLSRDDQILLQATARCVLLGSRGLLGVQLDRLERTRSPVEPPTALPPAKATARKAGKPPDKLVFDNGYGGFKANGREYIVRLSARDGRYSLPPQPWINVVANPLFGFVVSESGGGFTWAVNSQNNRLTPWRNDPVSDVPGEIIYLRDDASQALWTATPLPRGANADFTIRHGQGYTVFAHERDSLSQELTLLLAPDEPMKYYRLKLRNLGSQPRRLTAFFYAELVLGTVRERTMPHIVTEVDSESGALLARNAWDAEYRQKVAFADVNQRPRSVSADRTEFLGRNGSIAAPAAARRGDLSGTVGACLDPCVALQTSFTLRPNEEKEIVFVLGEADSIDEVRRLVKTAREAGQTQAAWDAANRFWDRLTGTLTIRTPDAALDMLVNRWLPYQVLSCRMWARSALYQSGGAYGFRDQLQDSLAMVYAFPDETRRHLVRAAGRQFTQGDVQHWWHPPSGAGVRTRISDDYLWLPFAVCHYVATTGDYALLDEQVHFLEGPELTAEQHEDYRVPKISEETATILEHCLRAIEHGRRFGAHGLPLMGAGDWNDGMNRVGAEGRGESIWLGWFLLVVLQKFASLCEQRGDAAHADSFRADAETLRGNLEQHAWDGAWYRRAYFDDGGPLGSAENTECRVDSLPQSWAVIAGGADPQRARQAMEAVDKNLVRRQDRLVLLFTPPFDQGNLHPGYIKGYVPGIRENGGQYTHAALWVAQAWALLGEADLAVEILDLINPILHADNPDAVKRYRLEPYVVAADVYAEPPLIGRGGWSWYTGSASWYYRVVIETLIGFDLRGDQLRLRPRLPAHWPSVELTYRFRSSIYSIKIERATANSVRFDEQPWQKDFFPLADDGTKHTITISFG